MIQHNEWNLIPSCQHSNLIFSGETYVVSLNGNNVVEEINYHYTLIYSLVKNENEPISKINNVNAGVNTTRSVLSMSTKNVTMDTEDVIELEALMNKYHENSNVAEHQEEGKKTSGIKTSSLPNKRPSFLLWTRNTFLGCVCFFIRSRKLKSRKYYRTENI